MRVKYTFYKVCQYPEDVLFDSQERAIDRSTSKGFVGDRCDRVTF
ncbi:MULTISPECIES: hypothetical protein [unclassified Microcoleus]